MPRVGTCIITRAQSAEGLCVWVCLYIYMYVCMCVVKKHGRLRLTAHKSTPEHSLLLVHWIYRPVKTFSVLKSLARATNPRLSNSSGPWKSNLRHCGRIAQPPACIRIHSDSVHQLQVLLAIVKALGLAQHWVAQSWSSLPVVFSSLPVVFLSLQWCAD